MSLTETREALERAQARASALRSATKAAQARATDAGIALAGTALGAGTAAAVGFAEGRFTNRDGSPLSLGAVPLPVVTGTVASLGGIAAILAGAPQIGAIANLCAAAHYGLAAGSYARGVGALRRARLAGPAAIAGADHGIGALTPAEREFLTMDLAEQPAHAG